MVSILAAIALIVIAYTLGSVKIINSGNAALVERLGRYHRTLHPGLNFIIPGLDRIVLEDTTREQVLDVEPQQAITRDNVSLQADAVVYWKILNLRDAFYAIEDIELAIKNLVLTTLRLELGRMNLEETFSSRTQINTVLLAELAEATYPWGVQVTRVEVQNISPARTVLESMEREKAAEIKKRADISEAQGTVASIQMISKALEEHKNSQEVLQYLLAQRYVDANYKLGESPNSKVIFMDPKAMTDSVAELIQQNVRTQRSTPEPGKNGKNQSA